MLTNEDLEKKMYENCKSLKSYITFENKHYNDLNLEKIGGLTYYESVSNEMILYGIDIACLGVAMSCVNNVDKNNFVNTDEFLKIRNNLVDLLRLYQKKLI